MLLEITSALRSDIDPHAGDLYALRGRRGDLVKILWEWRDRASLYAKPWEVHLALGIPVSLNLGRSICFSSAAASYNIAGVDNFKRAARVRESAFDISIDLDGNPES
ncbi:hypothetical protein AAE026_31260 [Bradyrhizobium sp. DN5]|uniref:hypothetical protein n=1 Tax=Bradyrhizobium sp. DN5 TaxID=3056950 RepID=UPI003525DA9F